MRYGLPVLITNNVHALGNYSGLLIKGKQNYVIYIKLSPKTHIQHITP